MTVIVVTGANSGIGRSTAVHLAAGGARVFGAMRDLGKGEKLAAMAAAAGAEVTPVGLDVVSTASVEAAIDEVVAAAGGIDVLVNNAGLGYNAAVEDVDIDRGKELFDVNFWGVVRCTRAVLPHFRAAGGGTVVNISSVTGRFASPAQSMYSASKWAVECMSEALAQEVAPFGIRVKIIEPGVTRTAMLAKNTDVPAGSAYEQAYQRMFTFYRAGIAASVGPEVVAETVAAAIADPTPRLRYVCAFGGRELSEGRPWVSDGDWVALGAAETHEEYRRRFLEAFSLDLGEPVPDELAEDGTASGGPA